VPKTLATTKLPRSPSWIIGKGEDRKEGMELGWEGTRKNGYLDHPRIKILATAGSTTAL